MTLASTQEIIAELKAGRMVILVDEEDRENEGDLVIAAEFVTPEAINFMARYGRGLICLTLTQDRCKQLNLPLMTYRNGTQYGTAFTVSIEAAEGVTTGISAADRARTIAAAVAPDAKAEHIVQPGHIFPIMAQPGGVLVRAGHTEAGCDFTRLAGLTPGRGDLRSDQGRRHDGASAGPARVRQGAWPEDRHDRRSDPLSQPHGIDRRAD
ncbi:3,4-dihydroxy-2-butanone 4-phosphate synthase [Paraburkholderia sp. JPY419]